MAVNGLLNMKIRMILATFALSALIHQPHPARPAPPSFILAETLPPGTATGEMHIQLRLGNLVFSKRHEFMTAYKLMNMLICFNLNRSTKLCQRMFTYKILHIYHNLEFSVVLNLQARRV